MAPRFICIMKKTVLLLLLLVLISLTVACTEEPVDSGEDTNDLIIDEDHISSNYTGKIDTIQINDYLDNFYIGGFEEEEIKLCYGTLSKREILGIDEVLSEMISKLNSNEEIVEWLETQDCVVNAYVNPWMLESGFFGYGPQDIFVLFAMDDGSFQKKVIDIQFEDFDYKGFLARKGIRAVMYRPEIELVDQRKYGIGGMVYHSILVTKDHFRSVINKYIPAPENNILAAMLLGDKGRLSDATKAIKLDPNFNGGKC